MKQPTSWSSLGCIPGSDFMYNSLQHANIEEQLDATLKIRKVRGSFIEELKKSMVFLPRSKIIALAHIM